MKSLFCLFLLLFPTSVCAALHYDLDINLQPAKQRLIARARIDLNDRLKSPLKLQLSPRCKIDAVRQADKPVSYRFAGGILELDTEGPEPISIRYHATFTDQTSGTPAHNEEPSYGVSASISTRGIYLSSQVNWYPRLQGQEINYRIHISAPVGIEAITSGRRISRQTTLKHSTSIWQVDYPLRGLTLSAGPYQLFEDRSGSIPIYAYFYADSAALATTYLQAARNYLQLYEKMFGPYPFHKFAIVENFFPTGYGLPSWTLLGSSVIKLPFIIKTSLGHEIAHSWWGIGVQANYAQGNWAEGLTTYVADYLYKERSSQAEAQQYRQNILRDYANLVTAENVFAINHFSSRYDKASQVIGYGKTAFLFHMLRKRVGEKVFWAGLRKIAQEKMYSRVGWEDFATEYSALSGQDLHPFFRQWLTRTTGPDLALQGVKRIKTEHGWRVSGKLTQQPIYQLTVDLQLNSAQETLHQTVMIDAESKDFSFETTTRPLTLQADLDVDLFRILAAQEIPATVNSIRGSNKLLVLQTERREPNNEASKTLLAALRKADLVIRSISEVSQQELATHDLLILGVTDQLHPAGLQSRPDGSIIYEDQKVDLSNHSIFIVEPNPLNSKMNAAWFVSQDQQAAIVARKISHYGKYSTLIFNGAKNRLKEIRLPEESPLRIEF
ncbi:MAG: M1 family peptidase [Geopsychrobacter sp.]|nr:M1 family peptidase [Geopsychrobacter sp.]